MATWPDPAPGNLIWNFLYRDRTTGERFIALHAEGLVVHVAGEPMTAPDGWWWIMPYFGSDGHRDLISPEDFAARFEPMRPGP